MSDEVTGDGRVTPALEVIRVLAEAEQRRGEALAELVRQGATERDIERVIALVTETACRLLGADFGMMALNEADGSCTWHGIWGNRSEDWRNIRYQPGAGAARQIHDQGAHGSLVVSHLGDNPAYPLDELPMSKSEGQRTGLVTPIRHHDLGLGMLVLGWRSDVTFTPRQIALAETLATYAATIIANAQALQSLAASEHFLRTLVANAPVILFALDRNGVITLSEGRGLAALGQRGGKLVGRSAFDLYRDRPDIVDHLRRALGGEVLTVLTEVHGAMLEARYVPVEDAKLGGVIGVVTDVTERIRAEQALRHQTLHDALTDLPNRLLLRDRLEQGLVAARLAGHGLALLLLDLDNFKELNDTLGHHYGDLLLVEVAQRLQSMMQTGDTVARLSGDEFAILLPRGTERTSRALAQAVVDVLAQPIKVDHHSFQAEGSIGVALAPEHGEDASTLLRHADVAMYTAKRARSGYALYTAAQDPHSAERLALLADLRRALAQGELVLHYQPTLEIATRRTHSVEALVRWQHPERGLIPPAQFIPLAEQNGLIRPMTQWVLVTAIEQAKAWLTTGLSMIMSVNLSAWDLLDGELPQLVGAVLDSFGLSPAHLCLELTEGSVMSDTTRTLQVLTGLAALGVHIAVDDFGTGYSSLAYLKRLPVDILKIDQSFVRFLTQDAADRTIVRATINMAHDLGLVVVAEGVEDEATFQLLGELGCDHAQGYFMGRPQPADEVELQLRTWTEGSSHT